MRLLLLLCPLCVLLSGLHGQDQSQVLESAYRNNSHKQLDSFFTRWSIETPSLSSAEIHRLNDTARNVYELFKQFYDPLDIQRMGGSEFGNKIYAGTKYLVVQDKIMYGFADVPDADSAVRQQYISIATSQHVPLDSVISRERRGTLPDFLFYFDEPKSDKYDSIENFRPQVISGLPPTVVLTEAYQTILTAFLGSEHDPLGKGSIMNPARAKGESQKRQHFLQRFIKIWYGHWGGYWQLPSYPTITRITFDRNLENALIDYQMIYEGGFAYFKKTGGQWRLVEVRRTWIE